MKRVIFALLAIVTLVFAASCTPESTQTLQEEINAVEKGTPPPPNG